MSRLRRGAAAALVVAATASALTACGETQKDSNYAPVSNVEYNPVNGINVDSTFVLARNLYLLNALGAVAPRLRVTLVNPTSTTDALVGASVGLPPVNGRLFGGTLGSLPVVAGTSVAVGSGIGPQITFPGLTVKSGTWVPVTLLFRSGRAVTGSVLVQDPTSEYSDGTVPTGLPRPTAAAGDGTSSQPGTTAEPAITEAPLDATG